MYPPKAFMGRAGFDSISAPMDAHALAEFSQLR